MFVSAGVETVSRYDRAPPRRRPEPQPASSPRRSPAARPPQRRPGLARPTRGRRSCPTSTSRWARPPRTSRRCAGLAARSSTSSVSARRTSPRRRSTTASGPARSPRSRCRTAGRLRRRRPAGRRHLRSGLPAQAGLPPRRRGHRRQLLPAQRRRRGGRDHVGHQGRRARTRPRWPASSRPASPVSPRRSWASGRSRPRGGRWPMPA